MPTIYEDITIAITSCGRFDLLKKTISSIEQTIDLSKYRKILTEDSRDKKHLEKMKEAQKNWFLQGREILFTGGSGQKDLYKCHYYALKTLYEHIDTKYVFHCEDDQIFRPVEFDYFKISYEVLEANKNIVLLLLRDVWQDFGLKKNGVMKDRYYEILTDEELKFKGYNWIFLQWKSSFSLQPGLRRTFEMKNIMFWYEDYVDESLVSNRLTGNGWRSLILKTWNWVYNHINPIFNSTKNIKNLGLWRYIISTLSGTICYRWGLLLKFLKLIRDNNIKPGMLRLFSRFSLPCFQGFWKQIYLLGLAGMGYWFWVNQLGHAKNIVYKQRKEKNKEKPFILFDVGANIWQTIEEILEYHRTNYKIFSFEPQQEAFKVLEKKFKNSKDTDISLYNIWFWDNKEELILHKTDINDTSASIISSPHEAHKYSEIIKIDTIDNFVEEKNIPYISYLKLDIEGAEYKALLGAKDIIAKTNIEAIEFEFLWKNIDWKIFLRDFRDLLSNRYNIYRILPHHIYQIKNYNHLLEIYCLSNFLCIKK